jgi:transcription initiation factor IIE alpha subunit
MIMPTIDNPEVSQKSQFTQQFWCKKCMLDLDLERKNFEDKKQKTIEEINIQTEKDEEYE